MTKTATYIYLFIALLLFPVAMHAQGWLWAKGSTGSGFDAWPVAADSKGNVYMAGVNFGLAPVNLGSVTVPYVGTTGYQCILVKYDSLGHVLWAKGTQNGDADLIAIATDPKGNVFLLGRMYGTPSAHTLQIGSITLTNAYTAGEAQYFLAKFDPAGNVLWAVNAGNTQNMVANLAGVCPVLGLGGIATDAVGNAYITTNFKKATVTVGTNTLTNADPSGGTEDILVAKYDPLGNVVWARSVGGVQNDDAYGITVTPAGDVYIAGIFASPSLTLGTSVLSSSAALPRQVAFIARFDKLGNPVWGCSSGGTGGEYAIGIASDAGNNVYMTGGITENSINFNGTDIANPAPGKPCLYLVKFNPSNTVSWHKTIYSISSKSLTGAWGYSIAMSACGVIWVSGSIVDSVDVDGHPLAPAVPYHGTSDTAADPVFIAGYTADGAYVAATSIMAGADDQNGIACDALGNVYMCADYFGKMGFTISSSIALPKDPADELSYLAKYASISPSSITVKTSSTTLCNGADIELNAPTGYEAYLWNDGSKGASRHVSEIGTFCVAASDSCVSYSYDTFRVQNCDCNNFLFVPNTFTPNGDGENDVFYPRCGPGITLISTFRVYNRWGVLVFERDNLNPNDKTNAWDGSYNGQPPGTEVFVWIVDAICQDGSTINKKGSVTIVR